MPPVLCVRAGGLGDVLLLRRAVATLRAGGFRVWLMAPERHGSALLEPAGVERVIDWESADVAALLSDVQPEASTLASDLRTCAGAIVYSGSATLFRAIAQFIPNAVSHRPLPPDGTHAASWYIEPALRFASRAAEPALCNATAEERRSADALLRKLALPAHFIAIHPGSGSPAKNWPLERFAALVRAASHGAAWLLVEGPAEAGKMAALRQIPGVRVATGLPARVLGAVLSSAGVYAGNDSGVSHLAACWGAPTVALFGPTSPASWAPIGPRVKILAAPGGDLSALAIDEVVEDVAQLRDAD
jgi:heptosyltransferase III